MHFSKVSTCGTATLVRCGVRSDALQRDQRERKGSKLAFLLQIVIRGLHSDGHCQAPNGKMGDEFDPGTVRIVGTHELGLQPSSTLWEAS